MKNRHNFDDTGLRRPEIPESLYEAVEANIPPDEELFEPTPDRKLKPLRTPDVLGPDLVTDALFVKDTGNEHVGRGLYAKKDFRLGEHVFEFDGVQRAEKFHPIVSRDGYSAHSVTVGHKRGTFFVYVMPNQTSPLRYVNHSCDPNIGRLADDLFGFVALRPIKAGEELTADYSLLEVNPYWKLAECGCGSSSCRHTIGSVSSLPAGYLQKNWERLTPEMRVVAIQFSKDPQITRWRDELGTDVLFAPEHAFFNAKNKSRTEILSSTNPTIVRERNLLGARLLAREFISFFEESKNQSQQVA